MICDNINAAFRNRYGYQGPEVLRGETTICCGCGKLLRSVQTETGWRWVHCHELIRKAAT